MIIGGKKSPPLLYFTTFYTHTLCVSLNVCIYVRKWKKIHYSPRKKRPNDYLFA